MVIKSIVGCRLVVDDRVNRDDVDVVDAAAMREGKRGRGEEEERN